MSYTDCHCHLSDLRVFADVDLILQESKNEKIELFFISGYEPVEWQRQKELKTKYPKQILSSYGLHPWYVIQTSVEVLMSDFAQLESEIEAADAIGELGLDYLKRWPKDSYAKQELFFRKQIELRSKPLVLHIVRAHSQAISILKDYSVCGLLHSFSGDWASAKQYLDMGLYLSFSPAILKSRKMDETIKNLPMDSLLIESDSPDQAPPDWPFQTNLPKSIYLVADKISQIKKEPVEKLLAQSAQNLKSLLASNRKTQHAL